MAVIINGRDLTVEQVIRVCRNNEKVELAPEAVEAVKKARNYIEKKLEEKYTCTDIIETLRTMMMFRPGEKLGYIPAYIRTDLTDALHETFGFRTDYEIITDVNMKKVIRMTKVKPRKSREKSKKSNNI